MSSLLMLYATHVTPRSSREPSPDHSEIPRTYCGPGVLYRPGYRIGGSSPWTTRMSANVIPSSPFTTTSGCRSVKLGLYSRAYRPSAVRWPHTFAMPATSDLGRTGTDQV